MKAVMSIDASGSWTLTLSAQTRTEKAMLDAVAKGYGVKVTSKGDEDGDLIIGGEGKREEIEL